MTNTNPCPNDHPADVTCVRCGHRSQAPESVLTKHQTKTRTTYTPEGDRVVITMRFDDRCGNGHNTFSMVCDVYEKRGTGWVDVGGGADHDLIARAAPDLEPYIKWHLTSTDGPMHYLANTVYHASEIAKDQDQFFVYLKDPEVGIKRTLLGIYSKKDLIEICLRYPPDVIKTEMYPNPMAKPADLDAARRSAIWPDATLNQLRSRDKLTQRLPALLWEFKHDMEALGFTY